MKIKPLIIFLLLLLLSSQLQSQTEVKDAEVVANSFVQTISSVLPEWKNAKLSEPTTYLDLDNKPIAYSFIVKEKEGFILISAEDSSPIEFSLNPPAHRRLESAKERVQNCIGLKRKLEKQEPNKSFHSMTRKLK